MPSLKFFTVLLPLFFLLCSVVKPLQASPDELKDSAVASLLQEAKSHYGKGQTEQAAALLERALRIAPRNPVLWHNLAGVRLQQQNWERAISLAAKSNTLAVDDKWLRIRNWVVIGLACEGMQDIVCARKSHQRATRLNYQ